jgi:uncharacterized membrane protein YphA (DoxX/SURF4 family)
MHMAIVVLSVLLTLLFGFSGTTKVFNTTTARNNAAHLGISAGLSRMIGAAEIASAIGLMAGLVIHPLAAVTAAAVCVLMAGGVSYHAKAKDNMHAMLPAAITGIAAATVLALSVAQ